MSEAASEFIRHDISTLTARPIDRVLARRDEQGHHRLVGVRRMPGAARIDRIVARAKFLRLLRTIRQLLVQGHVALDDADDFLALRMHFPARPALLETEQADDPTFVEVVAVPRLRRPRTTPAR